ncbi:MAG: multiheme c-type cytochrome [Candidatus Sulfotelmatobacter sp.]
MLPYYLAVFLALIAPSKPQPSSQGPPAAAAKKPPVRAEYAGDQACRSCHQEQAKTYFKTAHHLSTTLPSASTIKGSFSGDASVMKTSNPYVHFKMTATPDGFFQSAIEEPGPGKTISRTERIDIVAGEPRKGQSYLFWKGDRLFQLPVTYWVETNSWVNSPSYPDGSPHFDKDIIPRCLECHASYFEWIPTAVNRYRKNSLVLGIFCEKCHGPGQQHVALHRKTTKLAAGVPEAIVNPARLTRDRRLDVCGLCHSGNGVPIAPSLSFLPGDDLRDYIDIPYVSPEQAVDVHGNQVQLLRKSRCFQSSANLTCDTCHDVHKTERDAAAFSSRCLTCHQPKQCGEFAKHGDEISKNCIDCHMPLQQSHVLFSKTNGKTV